MSLNFIYALLNLHEQGSFEQVQMQIDEGLARFAVPLAQLGFVFDIVASPTQIQNGLAHQAAQRILAYVDQHYPDLCVRYAGITDDDLRRPMRDILLTKRLQISDVDSQHLFVIE